MKRTVWDIDEDLHLYYVHSDQEIFIRQDTRHSHGGNVYEIALGPADVSELMVALAELKVILDAEKIEKTLGEAA